MQMNVEVWNVAVVSVVMMLLYATCSAGMDMLNASLADSSSGLDTKIGYESSSIYCFVSLAGSFIAPFLHCIGSRFVIFGSSLMYVPLYIGVIFLNKIGIFTGAAIIGIGDGIVWVVVYDYVVSISQRQNLERNMSYFIFTYSFAALCGNLINYFNMEDATKVTDSTRIHIYTILSALAIIAGFLALFGLRKMPITHTDDDSSIHSDRSRLLDSNSDIEGDEDHQINNNDRSENIVNQNGIFKRLFKFFLVPATMAQIMTSIVSSICDCWVVIICTCIRNTYSNRHLIPIFGIIFGCCKIIFSGMWNKMTNILGYKLMIYIISVISLLWLVIIFIIFPPVSIHSQSVHSDALIPLGPWVVILLGLFTGVSRTWMDMIKQISCGACSKSEDIMQGFNPSLMFSVKTIFWSSTSAIVYATVSYMNIYVIVSVTFFGLIVNHFIFMHILLKFFHTT